MSSPEGSRVVDLEERINSGSPINPIKHPDMARAAAFLIPGVVNTDAEVSVHVVDTTGYSGETSPSEDQ